MGHTVFAHRNFNLHARVIHLAQHFLHTAYWLAKQTRWFGQLDHHHLTDRCITGGTFGNQNVLSKAAVLWGYQPNTAFLQQATNDGLCRTL